MSIVIFPFLLTCLLPFQSIAITIHFLADQPTIQAYLAVEDTVLIALGSSFENINSFGCCVEDVGGIIAPIELFYSSVRNDKMLTYFSIKEPH
ncbi:MAG: hypothetical protein KJ831_16540 [Candidatus Eisenbacteria bacterium]|nr:hypothetical protein [Candidatus Eisenbacteria bacterium]